MSFSKFVLSLWGWKVDCRVPITDKCVIIIAPHTSIMDFIWGRLALSSLGLSVKFVIKSEFFFFPVGPIIRKMGAVPVKRGARNEFPSYVTKCVQTEKEFRLVITPEGTRRATKRWKKGFWVIAHMAKVPVFYGTVDYKHKIMTVYGEFEITEDWEADHTRLKKSYVGANAKYPKGFTTD
ncbi:MAG: glycerol acyltransferase [Bacteroidetes bacterium HGW-Bacteroidetes-21]|nr:MAG: glycerol acyltransferase [Bacteroidetes bacterium HGW-Bacteroidetes-21]